MAASTKFGQLDSGSSRTELGQGVSLCSGSQSPWMIDHFGSAAAIEEPFRLGILSEAPELLSVIVFEETMSPWVRQALLVSAIILALLPLVEMGDHWETYGSDPEFVTVITVAAICFGFLLFRRDVVCALRRLLILKVALREALRIGWSPSLIVQDNPPTIRAPIRI